MRMQPLFSVIIRAYNASRYIAEALSPIINQTYSGPIEILVLYDEGTRDNTMEIISEFLKRINNKTFPDRLIRIYAHTHMSPFRSLQVGLKLANGNYITILDYDNVFSNKCPSFLFTNALLIDTNGFSHE